MDDFNGLKSNKRIPSLAATAICVPYHLYARYLQQRSPSPIVGDHKRITADALLSTGTNKKYIYDHKMKNFIDGNQPSNLNKSKCSTKPSTIFKSRTNLKKLSLAA